MVMRCAMFRIHHYHHLSPELMEWLHEMRADIKVIMFTLDDVLANVRKEKTQIDSLIALNVSTREQLKSAIAALATLDPAHIQAAIDQVYTEQNANIKEIQDALNENVVPPPTEKPLA